MSKSSLKIAIAAALITVGTAQISVAQSTSNSPVLDTTSPTRNVIRQPIKRDVQPVEYWVESSALNLRDNPVAGKVVGNLSYGQKILAYDQYENWIRVSKLDEKQQWGECSAFALKNPKPETRSSRRSSIQKRVFFIKTALSPATIKKPSVCG